MRGLDDTGHSKILTLAAGLLFVVLTVKALVCCVQFFIRIVPKFLNLYLFE